jgi:serine/threonine-protein kinase
VQQPHNESQTVEDRFAERVERGATITNQISTPEQPPHNASGVTPVPQSSFVLPFEPDEIIAGKYRVQKLIGTGGVGFVVAATHVGLDDSVALKFLKPEFATHPEAVTRFTIEARASFKIKNEHVARVLDVDTLPDGTPFIVMELLEGQDLRSILERHRVLPIDLAVDFALQSCEALAAAHACHIVHRDIKPENLFVTLSGEDDHIKVLDFGISKVALTQPALPSRKTRATALTRMAVGTPPYMSPEQVRASNSLDARADQWSLGCVLYELLTGNAPFERMSLMQACAAVLEEEPLPLREGCPSAPPELEAAVMRCLRKAPSERHSDIAEFARAIAPFGARYSHCAARCAELLVEGQRRSDPGYRQSEPPPLRRSDPLGIRIPTRPPLSEPQAQAQSQALVPQYPLAPIPLPHTLPAPQHADGRRPSLRFAPSPRVNSVNRVNSSTGSPLALRALPASTQVTAPHAFATDLESAPSPLTEEDLADAEELDLDALPGIRPRKNRWILLAVGALTALSVTYVAVRRLEQNDAPVQATRTYEGSPSYIGTTTGDTAMPSALEAAPSGYAAPEPAPAPAGASEPPPGGLKGGATHATEPASANAQAAKVRPARKVVKAAPRSDEPDVGF